MACSNGTAVQCPATNAFFNVCTTHSAVPLLEGWHGEERMCRSPFDFMDMLNSSKVNWVPLSETIWRLMPFLEHIPLRIAMVLAIVFVVITTTSGQLKLVSIFTNKPLCYGLSSWTSGILHHNSCTPDPCDFLATMVAQFACMCHSQLCMQVCKYDDLCCCPNTFRTGYSGGGFKSLRVAMCHLRAPCFGYGFRDRQVRFLLQAFQYALAV